MDKYNSFINELKKVSHPRKSKITNSYGISDFYKFYNANKDSSSEYKVNKSVYSNIIKDMNSMLINSMFENKNIKLPAGLGYIGVVKRKTKTSIGLDGKLFTNRPIDYKETYKLWSEDEEARVNKIYVRMDVEDIYKIKYVKFRNRLKNSAYYYMRFSRSVKQKLKDIINTNKNFDTYGNGMD